MTALTADNILAIPLDSPERLFSEGVEAKIKDEYRQFALYWHPDKNTSPLANNVLAHINILYKKGLEQVTKGVWKTPGLLNLISTDGTQYKIKYRAHMPFELGEMYVCNTVLVYLTHTKYNHLYKNAVNTLSNFKFHNTTMETEMRKYLPRVKKIFSTADHDVLCVEKLPTQLPLSIVLKYFDNFVDPRHVAWILSSLHNLLCYLEYAQIVHNDINLDTYFIEPTQHTGHLLGGWWYSAKTGTKLTSVPVNTFNFMTDASKDAKIADSRVDGELSRQVCRALLGDSVGSRLVLNKDIPKSLISWLRLPCSGNYVKEYSTWMNKTVIDAFGKRRYVALAIDNAVAYDKFNAINKGA